MNKLRKIALITATAVGIAGAYKPSRVWLSDKIRAHSPIYSQYRKEGNKLAEKLQIKSYPEKDAFIHAYTSASLTYKTNDKVAGFLGVLNEFARVDNPPQDKYMDDFNNKKGIEIAKLLKAKGVSQDNLPRILKDSLYAGSFIVDTAKIVLKK